MFFRYPGGKKRLKSIILRRIRNCYENVGYGYEYREPFLGAGTICFPWLEAEDRIEKIWINDYDPAIAAIWNALLKHNDALCEEIINFSPTVKAFFAFKQDILDTGRENEDIVTLAFKKIALQQMSFLGLGPLAGGPLGGKDQISKFDVKSRWNSTKIVSNIKSIRRLLNNRQLRFNRCGSNSYEEIIEKSGKAFLYLDPPSFSQGKKLYQYPFSTWDHRRLSDMLKEIKNPWLLSYDDCDDIRDFYKWATIIDVEIYQTGESLGNKSELLIVNNKELFEDTVVSEPIFD